MLTALQYPTLKRLRPRDTESAGESAFAGERKLQRRLGDWLLSEIPGKRIDFGCGGDNLYAEASRIASEEHVSVEEVVTSFFWQQIAIINRFKRMASEGSREKFLAVLDKVPHVEPPEYDRL